MKFSLTLVVAILCLIACAVRQDNRMRLSSQLVKINNESFFLGAQTLKETNERYRRLREYRSLQETECLEFTSLAQQDTIGSKIFYFRRDTLVCFKFEFQQEKNVIKQIVSGNDTIKILNNENDESGNLIVTRKTKIFFINDKESRTMSIISVYLKNINLKCIE